MKLLFTIASTLLISQYLGVVADEQEATVEDIQAVEEIDPTPEQTNQGDTEVIEDLPFELNE